MPQPANLEKATLQAISWQQGSPEPVDRGGPFAVQFNPESLKVNFANQNTGGDQRGGSSTQFVAKGSTKLTFDLWFDVTAPDPDNPGQNDVRKLTERVVKLMLPDAELNNAPPGVRFQWGTFLFEGVMDSVNETLEFFSEDGRPLRASVSLSLSQQEIQFKFGEPTSSGHGAVGAPGTEPQHQMQDGETFQDAASAQGRQDQWQSSANEQNIDNPRRVPPGTPIRV